LHNNTLIKTHHKTSTRTDTIESSIWLIETEIVYTIDDNKKHKKEEGTIARLH
jgi:hypothetical protein